MPTINQLVKKKRISKKTKLKKTPALNGNPQKHGTCVSIFTKTPRKPNSALRKVAKVRLVNSRVVSVYIPGEGHNLSRFSDILIEGRRIRDLPGVKYGALRGKFDLYSVQSKKNGRSKYGCKRKKPDYLKTAKTKRNRNFKNRFYYKSFQKMYSLAIVNEGKTLDHQKYWLKCFFYFNLLFLNKKSKEWDSRGHFFSRFKSLLIHLYDYKEDFKNKYSKKDPYKILLVNKRVLVVENLKEKKIYTYKLKD
jgi:small subunit ribosomal protein S12